MFRLRSRDGVQGVASEKGCSDGLNFDSTEELSK